MNIFSVRKRGERGPDGYDTCRDCGGRWTVVKPDEDSDEWWTYVNRPCIDSWHTVAPVKAS